MDAENRVCKESNAASADESDKKSTNWLEAIWERWPGDETDEEIEEGLFMLKWGVPLNPKDNRQRVMKNLALLAEAYPCICGEERENRCVRCTVSSALDLIAAITHQVKEDS